MPLKKKSVRAKVQSGRAAKNSASFFSQIMGQKYARPALFVLAFALIGTVTLLLTLAASGAGPIKGIGGKCLDNAGNKLRSKNKIQLYKCNGTSAQNWTVRDDGTIHLTDKYCLDVKYRGTAPGTTVWLWPCNGTVAQQWQANDDGTIANPNSGLCLDDKWAKTTDGNPVWLYTCNGTAAQKWTITKTTVITRGKLGSGSGSAKGNNTGGSNNSSSGGNGGGGTNTAPCALPQYPSGSCTGVLANASLTVVNGDKTYDGSEPVIEGKDFHGFVKVTGGSITFKNCIFHGRATSSNAALLNTEDSTGTTTVEDSEFVPSNPSVTIDGLWTRNTKLYRVNIHGSVDGLKAADNTLVQDSYIHDMSWFSSDPNIGGQPTHNDGVQTLEGSHITLNHNTIDLSGTKDGNSAWQVTQDFGPVSDLHAENNYLDGGGCTLNFAHKTRSSLTGIYVLNNRFGRHQDFSGCAILISTRTTLTQNSGNVWNDTSAAIPKPQQHD